MRILLAEDDPHIAQIVKFTLELDERVEEVTWVDTGRKALSAASEKTHDLLILDEMMPEGYGQDICRQLRDQEDGRPVLLMSAKNIDPETCGATAYMEKPFDPQSLVRKVHQLVESL